MEKRLLDMYDHMTMPDDCTRRIEARLQAELDGRKDGRYTKLIAPYTPRRGGWVAVAACLLLIFAVSGVVLRLWLNAPVVETPAEFASDYSMVTELPIMEVERFAAGLQQNIEEENWQAFSRKINYPITIGDQKVADRMELMEFIVRNQISKDFVKAIREESCSQMFCNWQGICMGDGQIWINEIGGELKVTAINGLFADPVDPLSFVLKVLPDDNYAIMEYRGQEENIEIPTGGKQNLVTQIGMGKPVIRYDDCVKTVKIPSTVQIVKEYAFANCSALEAVYFLGDAPPEAEGVFQYTDAVVYYQQGTKGWGDTWCGRKTLEYAEGHISLGTVTVPDRVPVLFEEVLAGSAVPFYGNQGDLTVEECCAALWGDDVKVDGFTLADMDDDGVYELIFAPQDGEGMRLGYLVLRQDGTKICRYTVSGRDLRKDGTFYSYVLKGDSRIYIQDEASFVSIQSADFTQQDLPLAQWHTYPCQGYSLVLETYRYASETGFSTHPGSPYSYFGTLLSGAADWNSVQSWLERQSVYVEETNHFMAFDPDAPGCLMYGFLTGTGEQRRLTTLGYYICDETGEYRAEAFELETDNPVYTVDPPPDDRGRVVESMEAMQDYLGVDFYGLDINRDAQKIAELLDRFVYRYAANDTTGVQECMSADADDLSRSPFEGNVSILSYGILPDSAVTTGESWHTSMELLEDGKSKIYYQLSVVLAKQPDGWKIHSWDLEKQ